MRCCGSVWAWCRTTARGARTYHFALHGVIERDPRFLHLWSKCHTKLLFQAPYQRVAKRSEMRWLRPELCVLGHRLEGLAFFDGHRSHSCSASRFTAGASGVRGFLFGCLEFDVKREDPWDCFMS